MQEEFQILFFLPGGFEGKVEMQLTGDSLLTAVLDICKMFSLGFKVILSTTNVITQLAYIKVLIADTNGPENSYVEVSRGF